VPEIVLLRVTIIVLGTALGAALGSFAGALLDRLPKRRSVWRPPSFCANCRARIAIHDNVPIISWLLLRGHCRNCSTSIPPHLFMFELAGALAGGLMAAKLL